MMKAVLLHIKSYSRWYLLILLAVVFILLWSVAIRENRNGILTVEFLNIGQGNATFIESPTGAQVIIDGGPNKTLMREISAVMPWYDRNIDMLIASHPDRDHYEGFIPLLQKYSANVFMEPGIADVSAEYASLKKEITDKKIPTVLARRGQIIDLGGGAYIEILFPDRDVSGLDTNNSSIIARLVYGDTSLLLEGDAPQTMENFVASLGPVKSDVIEVGHHGAKTSSSQSYLTAVSPQYAVISVGKNNSYGHPNQETLNILSVAKITALATCNMGRIIFKSDGKNFVLENKKILPVEAGCPGR